MKKMDGWQEWRGVNVWMDEWIGKLNKNGKIKSVSRWKYNKRIRLNKENSWKKERKKLCRWEVVNEWMDGWMADSWKKGGVNE